MAELAWKVENCRAEESQQRLSPRRYFKDWSGDLNFIPVLGLLMLRSRQRCGVWSTGLGMTSISCAVQQALKCIRSLLLQQILDTSLPHMIGVLREDALHHHQFG